jgi:hypothetical protein
VVSINVSEVVVMICRSGFWKTRSIDARILPPGFLASGMIMVPIKRTDFTPSSVASLPTKARAVAMMGRLGRPRHARREHGHESNE